MVPCELLIGLGDLLLDLLLPQELSRGQRARVHGIQLHRVIQESSRLLGIAGAN